MRARPCRPSRRARARAARSIQAGDWKYPAFAGRLHPTPCSGWRKLGACSLEKPRYSGHEVCRRRQRSRRRAAAALAGGPVKSKGGTFMRLSRRRVLVVVVGTASAALAAACSTTPVQQPAKPADTKPAAPAATSAPAAPAAQPAATAAPAAQAAKPAEAKPARAGRTANSGRRREGVRQRGERAGRQADGLDDRPGRALLLSARQPHRGGRQAERGARKGRLATAGPGRRNLREWRHAGTATSRSSRSPPRRSRGRTSSCQVMRIWRGGRRPATSWDSTTG